MMKQNRKRTKAKQREVTKSHAAGLHRSWWKQGDMKMAIIEDHASCWIHRDLTDSNCNETEKTGVVDRSKGVRRKGPMLSTTDRYQAVILNGHTYQQTRSPRLHLSRHNHSG